VWILKALANIVAIRCQRMTEHNSNWINPLLKLFLIKNLPNPHPGPIKPISSTEPTRLDKPQASLKNEKPTKTGFLNSGGEFHTYDLISMRSL